jgi:hypothetical protein
MQQNDQQIRQRVSATIIELMDCGGTFPRDTYEVLVEESPEVWVGFPKQGLIDLCDELQRSEVPEVSKQFQEMFREFNRKYFAGRLPDYEVRVVYDIGYWAGLLLHEGELGFYQPEMQRILLRITDDLPQMMPILLYEMARAVSDGNIEGGWLEELRRLRTAGAPVENLGIDWDASIKSS